MRIDGRIAWRMAWHMGGVWITHRLRVFFTCLFRQFLCVDLSFFPL